MKCNAKIYYWATFNILDMKKADPLLHIDSLKLRVFNGDEAVFVVSGSGKLTCKILLPMRAIKNSQMHVNLMQRMIINNA